MEDKKITIHKSVLVKEVLEYLNLQPHGIYVDATFGGGGHTRAILEAEKTATVIGIDWDQISLDQYGAELQEKYGDRFIPIWGNFAHIYKLLKKLKISQVDGLLADFGTSQMQLHEREGFSFYKDTPLDMRMSHAHFKVTAKDVVNQASVGQLISIFKEYGEERHAARIARAIEEKRAREKITSTRQLALLIEKAVSWQKGGIHPATRVFQALRIYVNKELENIKAYLASSTEFLKSGGRLVCISFHSLEDRIVKQFFKDQENLGILRIITKKPVIPTDEEMKENPSSRSAKLRAAERA